MALQGCSSSGGHSGTQNRGYPAHRCFSNGPAGGFLSPRLRHGLLNAKYAHASRRDFPARLQSETEAPLITALEASQMDHAPKEPLILHADAASPASGAALEADQLETIVEKALIFGG